MTSISTFQELGFAVLRGAGAPYVGQLRADAERLRHTATERRGTLQVCPSGYFTDDGSLWNGEDSELLTHIHLTYRTSAALLRFAIDEGIVAALKPILGDEIELFGQGQCLLKPPLSPFEKHWHQDDAFFPHARGFQVAALMYLQDTDEESGALRVVPGSHLAGLTHHSDSESHLDSGPPDQQSISLPGAAGDVILLHGFTVHGSAGNNGNDWRYVALNRYRSAGDFVVSTGTSVETMADIHVPFAPPGSSIGHEGILVSGSRVLNHAPGWAWPVWQQNQFSV